MKHIKDLIINSYVKKYGDDTDIDNSIKVDNLLDIAIKIINDESKKTIKQVKQEVFEKIETIREKYRDSGFDFREFDNIVLDINKDNIKTLKKVEYYEGSLDFPCDICNSNSYANFHFYIKGELKIVVCEECLKKIKDKAL